MAKDKIKQYIYIVQAKQETAKCKIGITNDLKRRLKDYNNITGKSKDNIYQYLFICEVKDMKLVEIDIKAKFKHLREERDREIYFYNKDLFDLYVKYIKSHKMFVKEIEIKPDDKKQEVKIIKRTTPSLKERRLTRKDILQQAQKVKNDEFYTRYEDIEKEIEMYDVKIWKDKVVFCNCDDAVDLIASSFKSDGASPPELNQRSCLASNDTENDKNTSAFASYFIENFKRLGLKKLICTHYSGGIDLFNQGTKGYIFTYIFTKTRSKEFKEFPKGYTGSFDDPLSLKILNEEADIICTNPPFSRMIDYWDITIKSGKKFLIISNFLNPITLAYIPYFKENKVWAGYNRVDWFLTPKRELTDASGHWYTNIPINNRPKYKNMKFMPLKEIPDKYKRYDDSKILMIDNNYIPNDYEKPFAVSTYPILSGLLEKGYKIVQDKRYTLYINGKECFRRVLVQKK